jgi:hypothetical protein
MGGDWDKFKGEGEGCFSGEIAAETGSVGRGLTLGRQNAERTLKKIRLWRYVF